jgi:hypothetical protein
MKIRHYRQIYEDSPDPIVFLSITVSTSGRVHEDFTRLIFLHVHREDSILTGELPEEWSGYYSHRFVNVVFHTFTSLFELSSSVSSS